MFFQLLAWNGGGSSNYTEIVASGGYNAATRGAEVTLDRMVNKAEELTEELGAIYSEIKDAFVA